MRKLSFSIFAAVAASSAMIAVPAFAADAPAAAASVAMQPDKARVLTDVLAKLRAGQTVDPRDMQAFVNAQNEGLKTGPAIGQKVPDFALSDENGKQWTLHDLMGPKGLLLVFNRSADW